MTYLLVLIESINCGILFREWKYYEWIPRSTSNRYSSVPGGLPAYQDMWGHFKSIAHSIGGRPVHGHSVAGHSLTEFAELDDWNQLFNLPMPVPTGFKWVISSDPSAFETNFMNAEISKPLKFVEHIGNPMNGPVSSRLDVRGHLGGEPVQLTVPMIINQHNYPADVYHHPYRK